MITLLNLEFVVTVNGCEVGRFDRYDDAVTAYLEFVPIPLVF